MYASHFAILLLAASAAIPALSAPFPIHSTAEIVARDGSTLAARDPGPSGGDIQDLLKDLYLRSKDASSGQGQSEDNDSVVHLNALQHTRDDNLIDPMKRDGFVDDIQTRGFFNSIVNGVASFGNDILTGTENAANDVESTVISASDTIDNAFTGTPNNGGIEVNDIDD